MQFTLAAAAILATASASELVRRTEYNFNSSCDTNQPLAKIVNRCSYPVHIWSIEKQLGCPEGEGLVLETGDFYHENLQKTAVGGIAVKISKYETCGGHDVTQLEYRLEYSGDAPGDYLDMSFVNCEGLDCPGRTDGYYFKSGNDGNAAHVSAVDNEHCPVHNVYTADDVPKVAYILPNDRQTKFCSNEASMELYLCGGEAPDGSDSTPVEASSSEDAAPSSSTYEQKPTSTQVAVTSSAAAQYTPVELPTPSAEEHVQVEAAAVTPAANIEQKANVMTTVVYETVYVDSKKRHAHGRRHQHYHA